MKVSSSARSGGGLKGLVRQLREVVDGKHRQAAGEAGATTLAGILKREVSGHVRSGRMLDTAEIVAVAAPGGERLQLTLAYDAGRVSKRPRGFRKIRNPNLGAAGEVGAPKMARRGGGPAVYYRMGGTGHGGPNLTFKKGFTAPITRAVREAYARVLLARLGGPK